MAVTVKEDGAWTRQGDGDGEKGRNQDCSALGDWLWGGWQRGVRDGPKFLAWAAEDIDGDAISWC